VERFKKEKIFPSDGLISLRYYCLWRIIAIISTLLGLSSGISWIAHILLLLTKGHHPPRFYKPQTIDVKTEKNMLASQEATLVPLNRY
jgi:hypothetical protein